MLTPLLDRYRSHLPPALWSLPWRTHPLDGKLLLFERDTGLNVLLEGEETAHLRRIAPRTLLIAVTNHCNLACSFCYRNLKSPSLWTYESLLTFCQEADAWGVLEVAFGGGEPTLFPRWADLINEVYGSTGLAINFTTNGTLMTDQFLAAVEGKLGQLRLSLYDDNDWLHAIKRLVAARMRFGVNWLVTPAELDHIQPKFERLLALGVRDFLLLSYKGSDPALHLSPDQGLQMEGTLNRLQTNWGGEIALKLDVCWGDRLHNLPRLFDHDDCGAGDTFVSVTSDKRIKPCSFHRSGVAFDTLADVRAWWEANRTNLIAAQVSGCARLTQHGLTRRQGR